MNAFHEVGVGMKVVDAAGSEIGTVDFIRAPDPKAAAFEERIAAAPRSLINLGVSSIVGPEPRVPPEMALRLFREGYIKIDAKGLWSEDYYAAGDIISAVEGQTVRLSLVRAELDAQE